MIKSKYYAPLVILFWYLKDVYRVLYCDNAAIIDNNVAIVTNYLTICDLKHFIMLVLIRKADGLNLCVQQQCWISIFYYVNKRGGDIYFLCFMF